MGLNIDRSPTQQQVEGSNAESQPAVGLPKEHHHDGGNAYVRTGKCSCGPLARGLGALHHAVEEPVYAVGIGHQFGMVQEIVSHIGETSGSRLYRTDSLKVVLRPGDRQKQVNEVVKKEGTEQYERGAHEALVAGKEVVEDHKEHHGVIGPVTQVEGFAPPDGVAHLTEHKGRLATEEKLFPRSKEMVKVGKQTVELIRVRIPVCQQEELCHHPDHDGEAAGITAIEGIEHESHAHNADAPHELLAGMVHPHVEEEDEQGGEGTVCQADDLYAKEAVLSWGGCDESLYVQSHFSFLYQAMVSATPLLRSYSGSKPSSCLRGLMSHCQLRCFII